MSDHVINSKVVQFFYGLICLFGAIFLFRGELNLWHTSGVVLLPFLYWKRLLLGAGIFFVLICALRRALPGRLPLGFALGGIAMVFASDWLDNPYSLLRGPSIRGEIVLGALLSFIALRGKHFRIFQIFALGSMLGLLLLFIYAARGHLIFSDDHPVFLQRLILLKENFPWIPFYNPLWNAGIDQRDFFATGALNVFLLLSPIIYFVNLTTYYTHLVGTLLFIIVPAAIGAACYLYSRSRMHTAFAIVLTIGNSLLWYRWALKYGTLGFICATSLIPLVLVLTTMLFDKQSKWNKRLAAFIIISTTLMLLWSPTGLVLIPCGIWGLFNIRTLIGERPRLLTAAGIIAINIPWILLFLSVSRVSSFVSSDTTAKRRVVYEAPMDEKDDLPAPQKTIERLKTLQTVVHDWAGPENPLILFFTIPALFLLRRPYRLTISLSIIWAALLGTVGTLAVPQLELDRMLIVAGLIAIIPVAALFEQLALSFATTSPLTKGLTSLAMGFLFASPLSTGSVLLNRTVEHYQLDQPVVKELTKAIEQFGGNGRVLFSGFILHELSGGHVAPLANWTHRQLVASSHVHDKWRYTNVIPDEFAKNNDRGIEEFSDLMNVSAVIAHERGWIQYYQSKPAIYTEKWHFDRFHIFERRQSNPSFFYRGSGELLGFTSHDISVKASAPEIIIKYNYFPFLRASACAIAPEPISETITFIKLSNCPLDTPIRIYAGKPWTRFFE